MFGTSRHRSPRRFILGKGICPLSILLTRPLRDLICVLSTTLSRLPLVRQDVRRRQKGGGFFSGTPLITCPPDRVPGKGRGPLHSQKKGLRENISTLAKQASPPIFLIASTLRMPDKRFIWWRVVEFDAPGG